MTTTTTTYCKQLIRDGEIATGMYTSSDDAATPEIARALAVPREFGRKSGDAVAIVRVDSRLGSDGDYHVTRRTIVELLA